MNVVVFQARTTKAKAESPSMVVEILGGVSVVSGGRFKTVGGMWLCGGGRVERVVEELGWWGMVLCWGVVW